MTSETCTYDLLIVGGGINGTGIALDAASRGLNVMLCEMNDLASATSSKSSKLIHGGLRYLEYNEFRLVREALAEREVLLKKAPHIMRPLRFRLPHRPHLRPAWMIRIGLFLYDHLSRRTTLKASRGIRFDQHSSLVKGIKRGFEYSDGWVDDARLVVLNAVAAREKGVRIATRTCCVHAVSEEDTWQVTLENQLTGKCESVKAKLLVNAAGPWVTSFFDQALSTLPPKQVRLVRGSHIIVPRIHDEPHAYILQNEDKRIVFVIPYEDRFSLIGTTDEEHQGDPGVVEISAEEVKYLVSVVNMHFENKISSDDIVSTYAGVRPLLDDDSDSPEAVTRDYTFELNRASGQAPLLSIFGGKITTYRKLSEAAVNSLRQFFPNMRPCTTATEILPGGDFDCQQSLLLQYQRQFPWLPAAVLYRFVRSYGTLSEKILLGCRAVEDLGQHFGAGLYLRELEYLIKYEWAIDVEDVLWRRTKLGLIMSAQDQQYLKDYLATQYPQQVERQLMFAD